ncbi:tryptophan 7-halogenase [Streptomyces agglomeratus]|uniref:tryptophan 7-halogenase n=1 Tax=Streptomyces agglomeratus TaxID=285458 RepID=UPI0009A00346|nr:tryptophan 7-halogenase [Streptomyces agglomeratus]
MSGTGSGGGVTTGSCDVLVAGGGPAGCAAALALVRAGGDVVIVSPAATADWQVGESCAPAARPLLERLGLLDRVVLDGHEPCYGFQAAWGGDAPAEVSQVLGPHGAGWHLDRARFDAAFLEVAEAAGASRHTGRVRGIGRREDHWQLTTDAGRVLRARYLVDATGRPARLARRLGATPSRSDRLTAVAGLLAAPGGAAGSEHTSLVESTPWGWWYTAPLPGGGQVLMAITDADLVAGTHLHDRDAWWAQAQRTRHVRHRIAHLDAPPRQLRVLAAGSSHTWPAAGRGWAAVGDAATATDPLAARGIVMALATGLDAARAILADRTGDSRALTAYARRIAALHREYLRAQATQYRREQRWAAAPFWHRRHRALPAGPST